MSKTKRHVLVTRPENKAKALAEQLALLASVENVTVTPLLSFNANPAIDWVRQLTDNPPDIIIFVSIPAVDFAFEMVSRQTWPSTASYYAVGSSTAHQLKNFGITSVKSPDKQDSEGLLNLHELQHVANKKVLIIRGNGGREHLKEQLTMRGAHVSYAEVYRRCWQDLPNDTSDQWKNQQINCIVITSNEMLDKLDNILKNDKEYWQRCLLIVASERIKESAFKLGYLNIINAHGASEQAIVQAINMSGSGNDRE